MKEKGQRERYLYDHSVNFVGGELEFVSGKRVSQTQSHGGSLRFLDSSHLDQMLSDASGELVNGWRVDAFQTDLFSDHRSKLKCGYVSNQTK